MAETGETVGNKRVEEVEEMEEPEKKGGQEEHRHCDSPASQVESSLRLLSALAER